MKTKNWKITGSKVWSILAAPMLAIAIVGCGGGGGNVSVLPSTEDFQQEGTADVKIDIFFMIDDSGSMAPGQAAMSDNLTQFIELFNQKGYDYRVAVGKTSAHDVSGGGPLTAKNFFAGGHGHRILRPGQSYDLIDAFAETVTDVGTGGTGYEAALQSVKNILNARAVADDFPRAGAHLAVIYLGDENDGYSLESDEQHYFDHLEDIVSAAQNGSSNGSLSTHAIQVDNNDCRQNGYYGGVVSPSTKIHSAASVGTRMMQMAAFSDGLQLSICDNFGVSLAALADDISQRASVFYLNRDDIIASTVEVFVNDVQIPNDNFSYESSPTPRIVFDLDAMPEQEASIRVTYTTENL